MSSTAKPIGVDVSTPGGLVGNLLLMTRRRRISILFAVTSLLLLALSVPVLATEDSTEVTDDTVAETEEPPEPIVTDIDPVVIVTTPVVEPVTADWTYRYLVPTGIALVVIVILITTARYFTNVVRKRYRIVEE
jgi:hypothetical protein